MHPPASRLRLLRLRVRPAAEPDTVTPRHCHCKLARLAQTGKTTVTVLL